MIDEYAGRDCSVLSGAPNGDASFVREPCTPQHGLPWTRPKPAIRAPVEIAGFLRLRVWITPEPHRARRLAWVS